MGCSHSAPADADAPKKIKFDRKPTSHNFGRDASLNKADYIFSKRGAETLIKAPRDIDGQQFIVEECEGTDMFLIDHLGMLTIDYCKECRIVCGPVASSVFIRNCENCVVVLACQQLRLRDCKNMTIFLHSTTGPIIESSANISIGCYNYAYFGLEAHLVTAGLSLWENEWYSVYDFTPANNFKLLPSGDVSTYIETVVPAAAGLIADGLCSSVNEGRITPLLYGPSKSSGFSAVYVFRPKHSQIFRGIMDRFVQKPYQNISDGDSSGDSGDGSEGLRNRDKLVVLRTTQKKVSSAQLSTLLGGKKALDAFIAAAQVHDVYAGVDIIACELSCVESADAERGRALFALIEDAMDIASDAGIGAATLKGKYLHWEGSEGDDKAHIIFEQWRVKT